MTATTAHELAAHEPAARIRSLHRPLLLLTAAMSVLAVVAVIGLVVDDREVTGLDAWAKPLKFALSTAIFAVSMAWLLRALPGRSRVAWWAGTVAAVALGVELVIIAGAAVAGTTSHFNVSSPFATALWSTMAAFISITWIATGVIAASAFRRPFDDPARTLAVRVGLVLGLVGMALAFLMTGPTPQQLDDFRGIAGAHTVGLPDGGPGLPILGWSTVGGDLRIPHFVGMHALQLLPLACAGIELAARVVPRMQRAAVRVRLVAVVALAYAAGIAVVTVQALSGQSVVAPSAGVAAAAVGVLVAASGASAVAIAAPTRR